VANKILLTSGNESVCKGLNVGHLMMLLQLGNMVRELAQYNTKMFAEKVMPRLKHAIPNGKIAGGRSLWTAGHGHH
jgi:hypothetical protein